MANEERKNFLEGCLLKHRELGKRQREYKKILTSKEKSRRMHMADAVNEKTVAHLEEEKDELRAKIWVAAGTTHKAANERHLEQITCHVKCQEEMASDIQNLKVSITNMEREIGRMNKQLYDLNCITVPDGRHQVYVMNMRKKLAILEDKLEVGIRQECGFTAANADLREQLFKILSNRKFFNESYTKMVQKLNSDKKYLIDLIEYALNTFDGCIDNYEKIEHLMRRDAKELDMRRLEMQGVIRKNTAKADNNEFLEEKSKPRELADLQPKEYGRRDKFRRMHSKKINLYNSVLEKILAYVGSQRIADVIDKFQQQESLYYSFFNYANEMSYHITLLNNCVGQLFDNIATSRRTNVNELRAQLEYIHTLEETERTKDAENAELSKLRRLNDQRLEGWLQGIELLCRMCGVDTSPLLQLLGDHSHVSIINFKKFCSLLEQHVQAITACVYVSERNESSTADFMPSKISKICELRTDLDDIVLTQQCPECAEGEAFNLDDVGEGGGTAVSSVREAKTKLYDKITQPEMQYRLHSISQCRLPRSRLLAAQRFA